MDDYSQIQPILDNDEEENQPTAVDDNNETDTEEQMWDDIMNEVVVFY